MQISDRSYRMADSDSLWPNAKKALEEFNARYLEAQKLFRGSGPEDIDASDKLLTQFAFRLVGSAPTFDGPFMAWMNYAFTTEEKFAADKSRPRGDTILAVVDGKRDVEEFLRDLDAYRDAIEKVIQSIAPERFTYQGFKILNPERLGDTVCRQMLEGADYVTALFKKRGVGPLLHTGVAEVGLVTANRMLQLEGKNTLGLYFQASRRIALSTAIVAGKGRFIDWVNEVFLHEFGHFVHLNYLPPAARAAWDEGWQEVKDHQTAFTSAFKTISSADRAKYFDALTFTGFDAGQAARRLSAVDKVKFGVWLRSPMIGDPLITAKQLRWTRAGGNMASFFVDRLGYMKKHYDWVADGTPEYAKQVDMVTRRYHDKLGLLWGGNFTIPETTVAELSKSDPTINKAVKDALAKLEIVSDYGQTNEKEDFAETFVAFLGAPEKLTPTSKFRMQRTLSLANFYNKPVMRLAAKPHSKVAAMLPTKSQLDYAAHLLKQLGVEADLSKLSGVEISDLISNLKAKRGRPVLYGNGQFSHWDKRSAENDSLAQLVVSRFLHARQQ